VRSPAARTLRARTVRTVAAAGLALASVAAVPAPAGAAGEVYVALGDSFASGPLVPDQIHLGCTRSNRNYPHVLAARLGAATLRDVTCSGADTRDLTSPQSLSFLGQPLAPAPPQFDALTADTTLVTITIGGNDTGLVGVAESCVNVLPFGTPCTQRYVVNGVDTIAARIDAFAPAMAAAVQGIRARSPQARVVVTGYGLYIQRNGCWPSVPVYPGDANWLQGLVDRLNGVIRTQALANGAEYVDLRTPSAGHDACRSAGSKWIEGFVPVNVAAPLHPNARGEAAYAQIIAGQL
jgi:lysophospholipase L1-like esterase